MKKEDFRTIIFGDVHGCFNELQDLLREVRASSQDSLISVGDLIGKGPDSVSVLDWAMKAENLRCVLGNHEVRFLAQSGAQAPEDGKTLDEETWRKLQGGLKSYQGFIAAWPVLIKDKDYLVMHAGFDPRQPLTRQSRRDLTSIRKIEGTEKPWYELYHGKRLAVFGHWSRREPVVRKNAIGLDTGCVYGGRLSALILPERRIVSVRARKTYREKQSW